MAENIKRRKFNLFDGFIILVIIAAIVVIVVMSGNKSTGDSEMGDTAVYQLEFASLSPAAAAELHEGSELYTTSTKDALGTVISVETLESSKLVMNYDSGAYEMSVDPDKVCVRVWVEAPITEDNSELYIDKKVSLKAGTNLDVWGPRFAGQGYVLTIEREGTAND